MYLILSFVLALSAQLLLGTLVVCVVSRLLAGADARRRWRAAWASSARSLNRLAPFAALAALFAAVGSATTIGLDRVWPSWDPTWAMALTAAMPTAGCAAMLAAARQESAGRFRRARRQARLSGELVFAGTVMLMVVIWRGLLFQLPLRRALVSESDGAGLLLVGAMVALICAGFIAVLGGLSGKPRPAALFAAMFYLGGTLGWIGAFRQTL